MIIESVLREAKPYLQGRTVKDAVIGISLIGVELDNGSVGVSYVLREGLKSGCSIFPFAQQLIRQDAGSVAEWVISGGDDLQRGIAMAVLGVASHAQKLQDSDSPDLPFGVTFKDNDIIGMIGFIKPVAKMIGPRAKKLYIFDKGISESGGTKGGVLPQQEMPRLLPTCDVVLLSGTTVINGSLEGLLKICINAREIVMIGPSTPMFPKAFLDTKVSVLAGSWWDSAHKEDIFKKISLASGIPELSAYAIKKSVRVEG